MDFTKFKPQNGERYIFIENGEPVAVLLSFEEYKKNFGDKKQESLPPFDFKPVLTKYNQQEKGIESKEKIEENRIMEQSKKGELKIEDLPF